LIIPVRPLSPCLSAQWVGLVTPLPGEIAKPPVGSLIHQAISREHEHSPVHSRSSRRPHGFDEAVRLALNKVRGENSDVRLEDNWYFERLVERSVQFRADNVGKPRGVGWQSS
jgi:hypothetical protein